MSFTPPNKVRSAYEDFLEAFRTVAEVANQEVMLPDRPVSSCFSRLDNITAKFERCLYLRGWPSRRLASSKRLDIVIKILETLTTSPEWSVTKSTVYLNYFVVSNTEAVLAQALHYDFVDGGQNDHPFFHAQLDVQPIGQDDLRSTGFDLLLKLPEPSNECWVTTRIPTPDMTFPSVLYCLVADHLGGVIFLLALTWLRIAFRNHWDTSRVPTGSLICVSQRYSTVKVDHLIPSRDNQAGEANR
jgi:hypothetical protein